MHFFYDPVIRKTNQNMNIIKANLLYLNNLPGEKEWVNMYYNQREKNSMSNFKA